MILPVFHQGGLFLGTLAAGFALAFIYDIFRAARRIVPHSAFFIHLEDFLYWLVVIAVVFGFLLLSNSGELRLFAIIGVFIGMLAYFALLSAIFLRFSMVIYGFLRAIVLLIFSIIAAPFVALGKILSYPAGIAARKAQEAYRYERRLYMGARIRGKQKAKRFKNNLNIIFKKV